MSCRGLSFSSFRRRRQRRAPSVALAVLICLWARGGWTQSGPVTREQGLGAWAGIAEVLQHPRCLNCHQGISPLQGDSRRPHVPRVARGPDDHGVSGMRCFNCHSLTRNNPTSGVPGAPHWSLPPATMNWQGLARGDLCRTLTDRKRNGNRSLEALTDHFEHDPLARWAWSPGGNRSPIPIPYRDFLDLVKVWVASGGVCPE